MAAQVARDVARDLASDYIPPEKQERVVWFALGALAKRPAFVVLVRSCNGIEVSTLNMTTQHRFTNRAIADILAGVAARLQILDANRFRIIAFQNADREHP